MLQLSMAAMAGMTSY